MLTKNLIKDVGNSQVKIIKKTHKKTHYVELKRSYYRQIQGISTKQQLFKPFNMYGGRRYPAHKCKTVDLKSQLIN